MKVDENVATTPGSPSTAEGVASRQPGRRFRGVFDLVVLGGGLPAQQAALQARRQGASVALVCAAHPSASRLRQMAVCRGRLALVAQHIRDAQRVPSHGSHPPESPPISSARPWDDDLRAAAFKEESFDRTELFLAVMRSATEEPADDGWERLAAAGVEFPGGAGEFKGPATISADGRQLRFRRAILAPGMHEQAPVMLGSDEIDVLSEMDLGQLEALPRQMAVIGSGAEACAWAQIFARLGAEVHLVTPSASLLPDVDPEAAALLAAELAAERVRLHTGCGQLRIGKMGTRKTLIIGSGNDAEMLLVDEILAGRERRLFLDGLELDAAGVAYNTAGIVVDRHLRTTNRQIYLAGPACDRPWLEGDAALATVPVAVTNALRRRPAWLGGGAPVAFDPTKFPRCVAVDPQIIEIGRHPSVESGRRQRTYVSRSPAELLKVSVDACSQRIEALTVVARDAAQWVAPLMLLMARGWPLTALEEVPSCGSGRIEALKRLRQSP